MTKQARKVAVIGLGYVGLPLAVALAKHDKVIAFDKNSKRIDQLQNGQDQTNEIASADLLNKNLIFTDQAQQLTEADFFIVAVPTPIDDHNHPDLSMVISASETIAAHMPKNSIIVYESTVYPGVTEEVCIPALEKKSGLLNQKDFFVGYSPERINPGDKEHTLEKIVKIISAQDSASLDIIEEVYCRVVKAGVYRAPDIKTAEAAKVIENTQRDINIALMNELSMIFNKMNIDTQEVLNAAGTKWNFLKFKPGLVGGHCIGVDPYYLTYQAQYYGLHPEMILSGRRINDDMGQYIAQQTVKQIIHVGHPIKNATVGILGLTFKENCPDVRNTKVVDIITELNSYGINTIVHDPLADPEQAWEQYKIRLSPIESFKNLTCVVIAVAHNNYCKLSIEQLKSMLKAPYIIADVKSILSKPNCELNKINLWRL